MVIFFVYWLPWVQVRLLPEGQQEQFELQVVALLPAGSALVEYFVEEQLEQMEYFVVLVG